MVSRACEVMYSIFRTRAIFSNTGSLNNISSVLTVLRTLFSDFRMPKLYRVAVLGSGGNTANRVQCTLKLFDLTTEEICSTLEKVDLEGLDHTDAGLRVMMTYEILAGGRIFPPISRQMVAQAMQGVEMLVAVVSTCQLNWVYWEVFECMVEDNLMDTCTVVLKLLDDESPGQTSRKFISADNALQNCGLIGDKWKGNAYILGEPTVVQGGKGIKKGIAEIRTKLCAEELVEEPIRETVSASKSLLKAGHRLISWLGRLVK